MIINITKLPGGKDGDELHGIIDVVIAKDGFGSNSFGHIYSMAQTKKHIVYPPEIGFLIIGGVIRDKNNNMRFFIYHDQSIIVNLAINTYLTLLLVSFLYLLMLLNIF